MTKYKPEELLQVTCADHLRVFCPTVLWWSSGNGFYIGHGSNRFAYMEKMKRMGLLPGVADLQLMWQDKESGEPRTAFIELKAGRNKPTPEQLAFIQTVRLIGYEADWTNSFDGFLDLLNAYNVPSRPFLRLKKTP